MFILVVVIIAIGNHGSDITRVSLAAQEAQGGCKNCHAKLSDQVPESHFTVTLEKVKYCLICHSLEGPAVAFDWVIHLDHYSTPEFVGDCWSCHLIDEGGNFRLVGAEDWKEIKVTEDMVEQMGSYFQSWATSEHLDHRHAQASVTCGLCHGTFFPEEPVSMEQCFICHGSYEQIAQKAEIHYEMLYPHFGGGNECGLCHKAHEESVHVCKQCH